MYVPGKQISAEKVSQEPLVVGVKPGETTCEYKNRCLKSGRVVGTTGTVLDSSMQDLRRSTSETPGGREGQDDEIPVADTFTFEVSVVCVCVSRSFFGVTKQNEVNPG